MLVISVEFLHGTYRADPRGLAVTGQLQEGEWPPSPLRLLAALVAADGTRDRCRHTDGSELTFLEECAPPSIFASDRRRVHHQQLQSRFVVAQTGGAFWKTKRVDGKTTIEGSSQQEYPARKGAVVRPGVRVSPANPVVVFAWDVDVPRSVFAGLSLRAARVGYLGAADSPVRVTVADALPDHLPEPFVPDRSGDVVVGVPAPGVVAAMDAHYDRWLELGPSLTRTQSPGLRRLAVYRAPDDPIDEHEARPVVFWLRLATPVAGRRVVALTEAFKAAVLDRYQRGGEEPPPVLHGHGFTSAGYELARFLALPDVGYPRSRGRIHGLALWLPPGCDSGVADRCRESLRGLTTLVGRDVSVDLAPWSGEARPRAANPNRWQQTATRWATVFPAVFERHTKRLDLAEVGRWCEHAGLPEPIAFRSTRSPLIPGGIDLAPSEVRRPGGSTRPYAHVEVQFDVPVEGPIAIGAARQRGLGLCAPVHIPDRDDA